jgi:hypothetical protein
MTAISRGQWLHGHRRGISTRLLTQHVFSRNTMLRERVKKKRADVSSLFLARPHTDVQVNVRGGCNRLPLFVGITTAHGNGHHPAVAILASSPGFSGSFPTS